MQFTKRTLAVILTLIFVFSLTLPAVIAEEPPDEPNPAMPVITVQPKGASVVSGDTLTLSVEAYIPNGDEIGYTWWCTKVSTGAKNKVGSTAEITITAKTGTYDYYVEVYNLASPEYKVTSQTARTEIDSTLRSKIAAILFLPLAFFIFPPFPGLSILLAPFFWIISLFS